MKHKNYYRNKEKHGRDIVSVFVNQLERQKRAFDDMIQEEKEDAKRNKRSFSGDIYGNGNKYNYNGDSRKGAPWSQK